MPKFLVDDKLGYRWTGYPVVNDPLYNHPVFGPLRGKGGDTGGKTDEQLVRDLIAIHNAENWLGVDAADDDLLFSKPVSEDKGNWVTQSIIQTNIQRYNDLQILNKAVKFGLILKINKVN